VSTAPLRALVTHVLRTWRREGRTGATYERVDSSALAAGDFHASGSMGLDGAPSMVFVDTMPPYSRDIDRPAGLYA
jgi:hypothetical protein